MPPALFRFAIFRQIFCRARIDFQPCRVWSFSRLAAVCYSRPRMSEAKSERRSRQRIPVRLGVSIRSSQKQPATGYTRDLSTSGIFLYADSEILVGSELEMVLMLPPQLTERRKTLGVLPGFGGPRRTWRRGRWFRGGCQYPKYGDLARDFGLMPALRANYAPSIV